MDYDFSKLKHIARNFDPHSLNLLLELKDLMYDSSRKFPSYESLDALVVNAQQKIKNIFSITHKNVYNSFLDIGCGKGHFVKAASDLGIPFSLGIDIHPQGSWETYKSKNTFKSEIDYQVKDILNDNFNQKFDLITSFNAFEHFEDPLSMLNKMIELLAPGGFLYIIFNPLWNSKDGHHLYRQNQTPWFHILFTQDTLNKFYSLNNINFDNIEVTGHKIISVNYFNCWSALKWYSLFCLPIKDIQLIDIHPTLERRFDWFIKIFKKHLNLPDLELQTQGLTIVYYKPL